MPRSHRFLLAATLLVATMVILSGCLTSKRAEVEDDGPTDEPTTGQPDLDEGDTEPSTPLVPGPLVLLSGDTEKTNLMIESFDGHMVPATLYRPVEATAASQVPVLLSSHGWSGTRQTADDAFREHATGGFGIITFDERGHGEAGDSARVMSVEYEIKDVMAVIDHLATLDWVLLDAPGDPRIGALGGSYGGGYQLLTAAMDPRLDAIAPEITWNNLLQSLAPNKSIKSAWIDLLYWGAKATGTVVHEDIDRGYFIAQGSNRIPDGTMPQEPDLVSQFTASSPMTYPEAIDIPTLLIQGMPDTLFNLNQAAANYVQIQATGAPVKLVTHLNGHIISTEGTIPVDSPVPVGLQPPAGPDPCGAKVPIIVTWYQRYLLALPVDTGPQVCIALEDETVVTATDYPLPSATMTPFAVASTLTVPQPGPSKAQATILAADAEYLIAGVPMLTGTFTSTVLDATVYLTLELVDAQGAQRIIDSQVTPYRVVETGYPNYSYQFSVDLGGIGVRLMPGESLVLVASSTNEQFAHNSERLPGLVMLDDLELVLPVVA